MTSTTVLLPILAALTVAQEKFLGFKETWQPTNNAQTLFLERYYAKADELKKLSHEEMRSCASKDIEVVNKFLSDNGFTIQLEQAKGDCFAVASILDILCKWTVKGQKDFITFDNAGNSTKKTYPAVRMKEGYTIRQTETDNPLLVIDTENGDKVFMTIAEKPLEGFELVERVQELSSTSNEDITCRFEDVLFPMVDIDQKGSIDWLIGLRFAPDWFISQALQQTRFQMNEEGAAAQSAVAISIEKCINRHRPPTLRIDKPFYVWIERPGMTLPLFAAYVDFADWKEPARLGCSK